MNIDLWKKRKKELKLKYEDISEISEIPLTTVKNIFCGYVKAPRIDTVQAIEKALGLTEGYNSTDFTANDFANGVMLTDEEITLIRLYKQIGERYGKQGQSLAIELWKTLLDKGIK